MRIGIGYDSHRLVEGIRLIIGGVEIPFEKGLKGHSDADVLCHSIIDALLGAAGLGDIGKFFPDTDPEWKNANSIKMLNDIVGKIDRNDYKISYIDSVILAEKPKLAVFIERIKENIASTGIALSSLNIKAKTNEGMGFIGKGEGIAAITTCLLEKKHSYANGGGGRIRTGA